MSGPLTGLRVVEVASESGAFAGKLLGDLGADVIVVEPPGGHATRRYEPFVDDVPDPERSLWWWHYNTSKRGVTLDLDDPADLVVFRALVRDADILLEAEPPGRMSGLAVDHTDLAPDSPGLIMVSITPYGRGGPKSELPATDLTVLADGGPAWSCGYDDHLLPPQRGGGNQGFHTACIWAVMSALTAVLHREISGRGQHIDVSMHAAANVTTEAGSYEWLVAQAEVQRQTNRHAAVNTTTFTGVVSSDGIYINTGFPPRTTRDFERVRDWLADLGLLDEFPERGLLEVGTERGDIHLSQIGQDPEATAIFGAGREAVKFVAERLPAQEFFQGAQGRGLACGVIYSPEEVMADPHFVERGFPTPIHHDELGRTIEYPGVPFICNGSPAAIERRAPRIGEHNADILDRLR